MQTPLKSGNKIPLLGDFGMELWSVLLGVTACQSRKNIILRIQGSNTAPQPKLLSQEHQPQTRGTSFPPTTPLSSILLC